MNIKGSKDRPTGAPSSAEPAAKRTASRTKKSAAPETSIAEDTKAVLRNIKDRMENLKGRVDDIKGPALAPSSSDALVSKIMVLRSKQKATETLPASKKYAASEAKAIFEHLSAKLGDGNSLDVAKVGVETLQKLEKKLTEAETAADAAAEPGRIAAEIDEAKAEALAIALHGGLPPVHETDGTPPILPVLSAALLGFKTLDRLNLPEYAGKAGLEAVRAAVMQYVETHSIGATVDTFKFPAEKPSAATSAQAPDSDENGKV